MKKLLALLLSVLMMCSMIPFAAVSAAEEITEPTIVISTVEAAEAGDEIEVQVQLLNNPGVISAVVEIEYDHDVMELVTYYDEEAEENVNAIDIATGWAARYVTVGSLGTCRVAFTNGTASKDVTKEDFFTATFKIKEDAPCGTYPLTVVYDNRYFINVDHEQVAFAAVDGSVTIPHKYVGEETLAPTCTTTGEMRYTCFTCEASYTEITPIRHRYCQVNGYHAVCAVCGEEGEITEPTIAVSTVEGAEAGDEIEVQVQLLNNPGVIGAVAEIEYDHDVMELVTYYDEEEEAWFPRIEVGSKYNAASNKYITFAPIDETGKSERCFVQYLRVTANTTNITKEDFFTATFRIKENAPCGTYPLTVKCDSTVFVNDDWKVVPFAAADGSVTINSGEHEYDNAVDTDCNSCGTIRKVANPIISGGNSVSELRHGLAFKFDVAANGIVWNEEYIADYSNATIIIDGTEYKLIGMGAIANNKGYAAQTLKDVDDKYVLNIPAEKVFEDAEGATSYAVRILNIPEAQLDTEITVCSYFQYEEGGEIITVYGEDWTTSYNAELN